MKVLLYAIKGVLVNAQAATLAANGGSFINNADGAPIPFTSPEQIRVGQTIDPADLEPQMPMVTIDRQGGPSIVPVAGAEDALVLVQAWSRRNKEEAMALYEWVSSQINMRPRDITAQMLLPPPGTVGGQCWSIYRQWLAYPFDEVLKAWYATARYVAKAVDYADLHSEFGSSVP